MKIENFDTFETMKKNYLYYKGKYDDFVNSDNCFELLDKLKYMERDCPESPIDINVLKALVIPGIEKKLKAITLEIEKL